MLRQDGFGMELDTEQWSHVMLDCHRYSVVCSSRNREFCRKTRFLDDQGVVPADTQRGGQAFEEIRAGMLDQRRSAMHRFGSPDDFSAQGRGDRLMPETDAEHRNRIAQLANQLDRDPRLSGRAGAWRNHDRSRGDLSDLRDCRGIVANDLRLASEFDKIPREIVNKTVIVIDEQQHEWISFSMESTTPNELPRRVEGVRLQ